MIENLEVPCSLETGQDFLKVDIYLDPKLACFRGHFPAQPLLPGIMQIQFVLEYACKLLGKKLHIASIPQLKFIHPVLPGQTLRLDLRILKKENGFTAKFKFAVETAKGDIQSSYGSISLC